MTELLAPAGNIEALDAALGEGADAVYMGLKSFNARLRSSNFAWNQAEAAVQSVHRLGKKIYITVNTVCEENETERLYRFLNYLNKIQPDGLIVQDYAVIRMCQEFFPELELHASTQMNVESAAAANLLSKQGLKRVVVARELGLEEIKSIKANTNAELEMFVHGALCVSESGLCLFSSYLGGKSANRGMCTQACRRLYSTENNGAAETGYYFSPCDMQLIDHVPELMQAGVDSFKIEGRMKSAEYVGAVTAAYRYVMDHWQEDKKGAIAEGKRILSTDFARSKTDYWYGFTSVEEGKENAGDKILNPKQAGGTGIYLGKLKNIREPDFDEIDQFNELTKQQPERTYINMAQLGGGDYDPENGDSIRLHRQDDSGRVSHKVRMAKIDEKGERWIDIPKGFTRGDSVYLLQTKAMSKRYKKILPPDLSKFRKQPGGERLPILDLTPLEKNELNWFPEGLYIQVSTVSDAHMVQTLHPVRIILDLNPETVYDLINKETADKPALPFSKKMTILSLDPFFDEGSAATNEETLNKLIEKGYQTFIVNNLAQINILKGKKLNLIAGPYLYTFNRWAVSFLENLNIMALQTPVENSEENLSATFETAAERSRVLLSVFSYPALFRMRFRMPKDYDFTYFSDKEKMIFKVASGDEGSFVMPEAPCSIIDKMETLKNKGWKRFLIDFTHTKVSRADIKDMAKLITSKEVIPGASRFNWKDGFYNPEKMEAYKAVAEREEMEKQNAKFGKGKGRPQKKGRPSPKKTSH